MLKGERGFRNKPIAKIYQSAERRRHSHVQCLLISFPACLGKFSTREQECSGTIPALSNPHPFQPTFCVVKPPAVRLLVSPENYTLLTFSFSFLHSTLVYLYQPLLLICKPSREHHEEGVVEAEALEVRLHSLARRQYRQCRHKHQLDCRFQKEHRQIKRRLPKGFSRHPFVKSCISS